MIRESVDIGNDVAESCDVVVIGSGCGGATLAKDLARAGLDVVMVERGGYYTTGRGDFDQRADNMLARIDGGRGLDASTNGEIALMYGNCVGGASVHYWGDSWRLPKDRAELWAEQGVSGHDHETLEPLFEEIERDLNIHVHGPEYYNRLNELFDVAAKQLGWSIDPVPQARRGCAASGHCYQGCSYDAKQSMAITYVPQFLDAGGRLYADVQVDRITRNSSGRADGVDCSVIDRETARPNGVSVRIDAKIVVLTAGGFSSPVIWLKSALPNSSGWVGRNFMTNPNPAIYAVFDEDIRMWDNVPAATGTKQFRLPTYDADGRYLEGGYLLHPNQLQPEILAALLPGMGEDYRQSMEQLPRIGGAVAWIDDDSGGRITLGPDGLPVYDYKLSGENLLKMRDAMKKEAQLLFAAGARYCFVPDAAGTRIGSPDDIALLDELDIENGAVLHGAPHPAGTLRMGDDPASSVVASTHEAHEVPGLFVADPSVFPSGPSVDPSETIMAFSMIAARNIITSLGGGVQA